MALAEKMEATRRGFLVRAGTSAAGVAALSIGSPAAALAAPAPQMAGGDTFRLALGTDPATIDPHKASWTQEIEVAMRVFRNLLKYDIDNNLIPELAAAMPEVSEDGTVYTFTLKDGASFSDGTPVTAADVEYSWKRQLDPAVAADYAFLAYSIVGAEEYNTADTKTLSAGQLQALRDAVGVRAISGNQVQFNLKEPAVWFLNVLALWLGVPVREVLVRQGNGGSDSDDKWTAPATYIGTGPFVLAEREVQSRMKFTANPRYTPTSQIPNVEINIINDGAVAFAAYLNDELDTVTFQREDKPRVDSDPVLKSQSYEYAEPTTLWVGFNTTRAPFNNQKVRSAFAFAIDRVSYVRNILGGAGIPARQIVPPGNPGHYEYELEEQVFNPTVARRLLAEAGFPEGRGLPEIKWTYASTPRNKTRVEALTAQIQQNLGVNVLADPVEPTAYTAMLKRPDTTPQLFGPSGWHHDYPDAQNWYSVLFHSKSGNNQYGFNNPDYDRYTEAGDREQDPGLRWEMYRQAAQILLNEAPVAPLYHF
ncbi:MAG TPA: peptide ABC transporter substrate-binding protein, partial [Chloroflexota bacterium]|nr:peptide ABC transporter substrate-binding protein [Chloroflexota bacterium]